MDEQMERAMDEIVPRAEEEVAEEEEAPEETVGAAGGKKMLCLRDLWEAGWEAIAEMNPRRVRADAAVRVGRKKRLAACIIQRVQELKEESAQRPVAEEREEAEEAPWTTFLHSLCPWYYN